MPLNDDPAESLAYEETLEIVGVGAAGLRRKILKYDYVPTPYPRVNIVAAQEQAWKDLAEDWTAPDVQYHASIIIRLDDSVVLTMQKVVLAFFGWAVVPVAASPGMGVALLSLQSLDPAFSRRPSVAFSEWDRYLPASARGGSPTRQRSARRGA